MNWLLVLLGGAVGAPLRYLVDLGVQRRRRRDRTAFPRGTLVVNVAGCLVLGVLTGLALHGAVSDSLRLLLGTGLCGALTTYSTFSYETLRLAESGARGSAVLNVLLSVGAGFAALHLGIVAADSWW
ncbi:fluoride efflux transporter CrcB [Streptomyces sp. XM4193]|uniref:fluoride efflux transporter CrcB n=1 Tax=Streptomyces sp. XM4193 TaxID=2929782 RepID=UPI001FFC269C|nr:fluoride efflux transporter CrcB [Streptomyces sp. XM4193]MCK1795693.1 fluoride efflux transporter CrcB [Streptomyces sp. XM4193]